MANKRILLSADSPNLGTGFGRVARELILQLQDEFDIDVISPYTNLPISYFGKNTTIYSLNVQGKESLPKQTEELLRAGKYDLFYIISPFDVVSDYCKYFKQRQGGLPPVVAYIPVEQEYLNGWQVANLDFLAKVVLYHPEAARIFESTGANKPENIVSIGHGVDLTNFKPLENKVMLKETSPFGLLEENPFIITVATNQWRKNPFPAIAGFLLFANQHPELGAKYYIHMPRGGYAGWLPRMVETAKNYLQYATGKEINHSAIILPSAEDPYITDEKLNELYNMADAVLSTSIAEGWNFMLTEAMAAKTLCIAPLHTSHTYILGSEAERGVPITIDDFEMCTSYGYNEVARHTVSVMAIYEALKALYVDKLYEKESIVNEAYKFVQQENLSWEYVGKQWAALFRSVIK